MRTCLPLLVLFGCGGLVACGGSDEGRPAGASFGQKPAEVDYCSMDEGYEFFSLLDFEPHAVEGESTLSHNAQCNPEISDQCGGLDDQKQPQQQCCSFYFNYDTASSPANSDLTRSLPRGEDCRQLAVPADARVFTSPRWAQSTIEAQEIEGGQCGQEGYGLHIITENVGMCYGSDGRLGWGATFDITFAQPLDATQWDGISLWVKNSPEGEKPAIIIQFVDPNTSGAQDPKTLEPTCDASDPALGQQPVPDSEKCDSFGTAVTLTKEWSFVPVRFDSLRQKGYGKVSPLGRLKTDEIVRMQIYMNYGNADFWVDDIALFRSAKPAAKGEGGAASSEKPTGEGGAAGSE